MFDFPSSTDENQPDKDMAIFAPLESDIDGESQVSLIFDYSSVTSSLQAEDAQ